MVALIDAQRGSTLIEIVVVVAITAMLVGAATFLALGTRPYALRGAIGAFTALVDEAHDLAVTTGDGATLAVSSDGQGGFVAALYAHRPMPGSSIGATPVHEITAHAGIALNAGGSSPALPFAVFVSSSGGVSAAAWQPGTVVASEPPCNAPLQFSFSNGTATEVHSVDCADARLR